MRKGKYGNFKGCSNYPKCRFTLTIRMILAHMKKEGNPSEKVYKLLVLFCILNALDYITTIFAISYGAAEGNLIPSYFVSHNALKYYKFGGVGILCKVPEVKLTSDQLNKTKQFTLNNFIEYKALPIAIIGAFMGLTYSSIVSFLSSYTRQINLIDIGSMFFVALMDFPKTDQKIINRTSP